MQNYTKGLLTPKTGQDTLSLSEDHDKALQTSTFKKQQNKNIEMEKENIDVNLLSSKEAEINPEKFSGPGHKPKTANKAFGGISDFVLFFENRNPEMKEFAKKFKNIEKMDSKLSIAELNKVIVSKIDECLNQMYQKIKGTTKPKMRKLENKYAKLFKNSFKTLEEFYKQVFHAYTINGFLYKKMNKYLRNEDWMKLDALLPYVYCLFKAFLWGPTGLMLQESFEALKAKSKRNKLTLFRGADFDDESLNFYDPRKIKNFSWNGVISTSLIESVTKKFQGDCSKRPILIIIEIDFENLQPENLNALYLAGFSEYPKEEEVALPPGSIFELLDINKENPEVVMRLRLVTNVEALAHKGQFMHGMLQAIMRNENELKVVCLKEKELSRALKHCQGNRLIKEIEFCFCIFNKKSIQAFKEVIPTIENMTCLILNIVKFEEDCRLDEMLECFGETRIKELHIFATLDEKRHIESMVESMKYLSSLEYLKLELEEDCQMDSSLFQDLLVAACQYLNPKCLFDVDIGTRYNLVTKGPNHNDFERLDIMKAINQNWPPFWCHPPKSTDETKFMSEDPQVKQHPETTQTIKEKFLSDRETQTLKILDSEGLKDERNENIEIIESSRGMRKYCLEGRTQQLESLSSLHLRFGKNEISNEEMINFCSDIRHLQSLKTLDLIFDECRGISDEKVAILSCQGIQKLSSLTYLSLSLKNCSRITDNGLMYLSSEGIRYLPLLTSLTLNFAGSSQITDKGLMYLSFEGIRHLPLLTSLILDFMRCFQITDKGLMYLSSEGIQYLPLLTSLDLNLKNCDLSQKEIKNILSLIQSKIDCLNIHQPQVVQSSERIHFSGPVLQNLSNSNQSALFLDYHVEPGFYFKEHPFKCEQNIHKLLKNHSPSPFKDFDKTPHENCLSKETQKNYQATFHLNFGSIPLDDDHISNLEETATSWQDVKTLNLIFNCYPLLAPQRFQSYWNIFQYFNSIVNLSLSFNEVTFSLNERLSSLFDYEKIKNLKSLKSINFIFPNATINQKVRRNIFEASSSFALNFLTKKKFEMKKADFKISKRSVQSTLKKKSQICKIKSHEIQTSLQSNLILSENFDKMDLNHTSIQNIQSISSSQRDGESEFQSALNENTNKRHFVCQGKITNSQEKFKPFLSRDITFSENQNISIQELDFQELSGFKSLSELNLNLSRRNDITNERLQTLSAKMSDLASLRILNLSFYGCTRITDEGLSNLSSQGLKPLRKLTELSLDFGLCNGVTDKGLDCLSCEGIKNLEFLTKLKLNFEWCLGLENLSCKGIGSLKRLTELHLNFNNCTGITDIEAEWLSCGLQNLKSLIILSIDFGYDKVYDLDVRSLSKGIQYLESITDLYLNFSHCRRITDLGLEWLSHGLQSLKLLTTLSLNFDKCYNISDQSIKSLSCGSIRYLKSLTYLHLSFDGVASRILTDEALESLCEGIQHLDNLRTLELISQSQNQITDQGIKILAFKAMSKLISLENLQLPLMQTVTSSSSIAEAFRNILKYFGLQKVENL